MRTEAGQRRVHDAVQGCEGGAQPDGGGDGEVEAQSEQVKK